MKTSPTLRQFVRVLWASIGAAVAGGPALVLAATTKPDAGPAAATVAPISPAEIKKLQDTIKGLHDRFEDQGRILNKNSDDLGKITFQVDEFLKASRFKPLEDGLAAVVRKIGDLNTALGNLADAQAAHAAAVATQAKANAAALDHLREMIARETADANATAAQLRKDLALSFGKSGKPAAPTENSLPLAAVLGSLGGVTLLLAGLILTAGARARRAQREMQLAVTAALARLSEATANAREPAGAGIGADGLAEILAKLQTLAETLTPAPSTLPPEDHTTKKPPPPDEQTTVRLGGAAGAISPTACWPAVFLDPVSPLAAWRERIESHLGSSEHPALPVLSALLALRVLCGRQPAPSLAEVGAAVTTLSLALHDYWDSLPALSEDERTAAGSDWIKAVKALVSTAAPKLEIREIVPGARFDSNSMQTVGQGSGNHLAVTAVHSWVTLDRSEERVKVLQRARVTVN